MSLDEMVIDSFLREMDGLLYCRNVFTNIHICWSLEYWHTEIVDYFKTFSRFSTIRRYDVAYKFSDDFRRYIIQHHSYPDGTIKLPSRMKGIKTWILDYAK